MQVSISLSGGLLCTGIASLSWSPALLPSPAIVYAQGPPSQGSRVPHVPVSKSETGAVRLAPEGHNRSGHTVYEGTFTRPDVAEQGRVESSEPGRLDEGQMKPRTQKLRPHGSRR